MKKDIQNNIKFAAAIIILFLIMVAAALTAPVSSEPTLKAEYFRILKAHPECMDAVRLELITRVSISFSSGPGAPVSQFTDYFLICDSAALRVEVKP